MKYDVVIGLEVHVQLNTISKLFCSCKTKFGAKANTQTCPVCQGHPGTLPVLNKAVLDKAIKTGLALSCSINHFSKFDRKNYFYPDLPKAYQISQYDLPICTKGYLKINLKPNDSSIENNIKCVNINRIHIEEDAGKLIHSYNISYVDLNRCGVPLLEIVSEPDIRSSTEAYMYLSELKNILRYIDVSDCNMEEGSLRCDANVSLREMGDKNFGVKVEIKNLNSFKGVQKALDYEIKRQSKILSMEREVIQETRLYNVDENKTYSMRSKGDSHDYRYFPDPDLVPIVLKEEDIEKIAKALPELPQKKQSRFIEEYKLSKKDVLVLTSSLELAKFFEKAIGYYPKSPKKTANWIIAEFMRALNDFNGKFDKIPIDAKQIADIVRLIDEDTISGKIGKLIFEEIITSKKDLRNIPVTEIIKDKNLKLMSNKGDLDEIIKKVIDDNPEAALSFRQGKDKAIGFLVGQIMKLTKGQANPSLVNKLLRETLKSR